MDHGFHGVIMRKPSAGEHASHPNPVSGKELGPDADGGFGFALPPGVIFAADEDAEDAAGPLMCTDCGSRLMYPGDCEEQGRDRWCLELICPECGSIRPSVFDLDMLNEIDTELEQAEAEIEADLERLTNANMLDYVTRFTSALNAGAIDPIDFAA